MRASLSFVRWANSSLVYISGYWVLSNAFSSSSNWYAVKVVRDLLCFLLSWIPGSASISESPSPSPTAVRSSCFTATIKYLKNIAWSSTILHTCISSFWILYIVREWIYFLCWFYLVKWKTCRSLHTYTHNNGFAASISHRFSL